MPSRERRTGPSCGEESQAHPYPCDQDGPHVDPWLVRLVLSSVGETGGREHRCRHLYPSGSICFGKNAPGGTGPLHQNFFPEMDCARALGLSEATTWQWAPKRKAGLSIRGKTHARSRGVQACQIDPLLLPNSGPLHDGPPRNLKIFFQY